MSKNSNDHSMFVGCLGLFVILSLLSVTLLGSTLYLNMKPKDKIRGEIIKKGDEFSIDNKDLSNYIDVLEDLDISYKTSKDGDKTAIKINRSNK